MANNKDFIVKNGLTVGSDASVSGRVDAGNVTITSTDGGSGAGPDLILYRNSASPNDGDYLGQIQFKGRNDGPGDEIYAKVTGKISDSTNSTEDGLIETAIKGNGTFTIVSRQKSNELQLLNGVGLSVDGSISVGGTVDGRDIATDGSKLDGIESGATADQSASEILTAVKTVDGSGSGLDADTVDGIHASGLVSNNYFQDNSGGGATGGGSDKIFHNNDQTVTTSYSIPSGQNSMTAGPISINSGVTVTVPSGSEWTIV